MVFHVAISLIFIYVLCGRYTSSRDTVFKSKLMKKTTFPCKSHADWWGVVFVVLGFPRRCRRRGIAARTNEKTSVFHIWSYLRISLRVPFRIGAEDGCVVSNEFMSQEILTRNPKFHRGHWTSLPRSMNIVCQPQHHVTLFRAWKKKFSSCGKSA